MLAIQINRQMMTVQDILSRKKTLRNRKLLAKVAANKQIDATEGAAATSTTLSVGTSTRDFE